MDCWRFAGAVGYRVGLAMKNPDGPPIVELQETLAAIDRALDLLERLQSAQHSGNIHLEKPREKMRWSVKRLAHRAWRLSTEIEHSE